MNVPRPASVVSIIFKNGGKISIKSMKEKPELRALMKDDEIILTDVGITEATAEPGSKVVVWIMKNEEIHLKKEDVLFYSIQEVHEPPKIQVMPGIVGVQ